MLKIKIVVGLLSISSVLMAQLTVDAEIRPRAELRNGYKDSQTSDGKIPEFVVTQRTGLGLLYEEEKVKGYVNFQDVRTWGETAPKKDASTIHIREAWVEVSIIDGLSAKAGRQILKYDNQRVLAATNWNQISTSHDALVLKFKTDKLSLHAGFAYNNEKASSYEDYYPVPYYKSLIYGWMNYKVSDMLEISLLSINDNNVKDSTANTYYSRYTNGGNIFLSPIENLKVTATAYYQSGKNTSGKDVSAYLLAGRVDYKIAKGNALFVGADVYGGGDPNVASDTDNKFNRLYGAKHKHLGYMDYYPVSNTGIFDGFLGATVSPLKNIKTMVVFHSFMLPHDYTNPLDPTTKLDKNMGSEIDIKMDYKISSSATLSFIHAMYFGTSTTDVIKGGDHTKLSNFTMVMLIWKPKYSLSSNNE